jgi:hypothetical protein
VITSQVLIVAIRQTAIGKRKTTGRITPTVGGNDGKGNAIIIIDVNKIGRLNAAQLTACFKIGAGSRKAKNGIDIASTRSPTKRDANLPVANRRSAVGSKAELRAKSAISLKESMCA